MKMFKIILPVLIGMVLGLGAAIIKSNLIEDSIVSTRSASDIISVMADITDGSIKVPSNLEARVLKADTSLQPNTKITVSGIASTGPNTNTAITVWRSTGGETKASIDNETGEVIIRGIDSDERYGWVNMELISGSTVNLSDGVVSWSTPRLLNHNDTVKYVVPGGTKYIRLLVQFSPHAEGTVWTCQNGYIACREFSDSTVSATSKFTINENTRTYTMTNTSYRQILLFTNSTPVARTGTAKFVWGIRIGGGGTMITNSIYVLSAKAYIGD